jgi:integrase
MPWLDPTKNPITPETPFSEAADLWLGSIAGTIDIGLGTRRRVRENTEQGYRGNVRTLKLFFRDMPLRNIDLFLINRYEAARVAGAEPFVRFRRPQDAKERRLPDGTVVPAKGKTSCPAQPKKTNQEVIVLKHILRIGGAWSEAQDELHKPLPEEEPDIQRALSPEEQKLWLAVARSSERWHIVYYYSELAFATCMSTNEIRSLRLSDIHLDAGIINISWSGSKNCYRHRTVEIGRPGDPSWNAVEWLLARANKLGSKSDGNYLFPFRDGKETFDPTRPMTVGGLKKLWEEVRIVSGLKWFRQYDTRHTAITRLAEDGTEIATIMKMAGHISPKMTEHYTHISHRLTLQAMRRVGRRMRGVEEETRPETEARLPVIAVPAAKPAIFRLQAIQLEPKHPMQLSPQVHVHPSVPVENDVALSAPNAFFLCGSTTAMDGMFF